MRILLVTSADIHLKSGGGFANRAFYDSLISHYPDCVDVIQYAEAPPRGVLSKLKAVMHGKMHRLYFWLLDYLDQRNGIYQVCVINSGLFGDLVPEIKKKGIRVVTIHHNYEVVFNMDTRTPYALWGLTPFLVSRNERKAYLCSDMNLFLSDYDRKMMLAHYGASSAQDVVVGIYETKEQSNEIVRREAVVTNHDVAITGWLANPQTKLGLKDFQDHYHDLLRKIMPSARLIVAGRTEEKDVASLTGMDDVVVIPNPSNISEVIKGCSMYLCPVNVGSGVKYRIKDGLRLGIPVLAHAVSARGYEMFADKLWFQSYEDVASFERGMRAIMNYVDRYDGFRDEIIKEYKSYFSFEAGDKRFMEAFSQLL